MVGRKAPASGVDGDHGACRLPEAAGSAVPRLLAASRRVEPKRPPGGGSGERRRCVASAAQRRGQARGLTGAAPRRGEAQRRRGGGGGWGERGGAGHQGAPAAGAKLLPSVENPARVASPNRENAGSPRATHTPRSDKAMMMMMMMMILNATLNARQMYI